MIKKVLLALAIGIGSLVLLIVLAVLGYIAYGIYANNQADRAAVFLCNRALAGSGIDTVIANAKNGREQYRLVVYEKNYRFIYYGAIFHSSECVVDTFDGKVVSAKMVVNED